MATIVNARDVLLQAASPRFLGVQVGPNIQVPIVNIPGLSTALDGTREVTLTGTSQVYQIPKTGSISPASITVSAVLRNLTGTPTLTLTNGTMSVTPALTGGVFTFTPAQMTSDTITLHLSLTVGADTFTDDWTVVKVREGADALTGFLTNESCTVAADKLGNVTSYTGVNGLFKVFQGATDVTTACTFSVPSGGNPNSLTYSLTASGGGAGTYSVSGGFGTGGDQVSLTIRATFGSTTIDKVFSISKSKAGSNGSGAFNLVGSTNLTVDGNTITKTGGSPWDEQAYSIESYTGGAYISFRSGNISASLMGALNPSPTTDASFTSLKYAWYIEAGATNCYPWQYTGAVAASAGGWSPSTVFSIVYDGVNVKWYKDGALAHTLAVAAGEKLFFDSSFAETGATMNSIAFGPSGVAGTNGTSGARGSQTFYVAISGTSYSDAVASSTASVNGGPIYGDVVTQYDNAAGFALSKFWDGTSSWVTINAVVDGNLLVQGTVGAQKLIVNNGSGNNLWWDANFQQNASGTWYTGPWGQYPSSQVVSDGVSGGFVARSGVGSGTSGGSVGPVSAITTYRVPVTIGKQYRFSVKVRKSTSGNAGIVYFRANTGTAATGGYSDTPIGVEGNTVGTSWGTYSVVWTATTPYVGAMILINFNDTAATGYQEWQDLRIEEMMDYALIVQGGIKADNIDTTNLTIKDGSGTVLFGSGTNLDWANLTAQPSNIYNNNISVSLASNAYTINGIGSSGTINIGGLGYTGDLNATLGAPTGTYVAGDLAQDVLRPSLKISTSNISTYINAAAIGAAYIGVLTAGNLTVTAVSDTVNGGATSGGRVEITTNRIDVFDASNVRRVRMGLL